MLRTITLIFLTLGALLGQYPAGLPLSSGGSGSGVSYCAPASASGTTYTCSPSTALTSYSAGVSLAFVPDVNGSGGATTVNVSSLGAKSIKLADGSTNPNSTSLVASQIYVLVYDGTVFRLSPSTTLPAFATVTDASPIAWTLNGAVNGTVTLNHATATRALNVSGLTSGTFYSLIVKQDATGGAAMTLGTGCTWKVSNAGAGAIALSAAANAIDVLSFTYDGTNCYASIQNNFN